MENALEETLDAGTPARIVVFRNGQTIPGAVRDVNGRTLHATAAERIALRECVKVESGNQLWIGELWSCESRGSVFHVEVEVHSMLNDVAAVNELAAHFKHTRPAETDEAPGQGPTEPGRSRGEKPKAIP